MNREQSQVFSLTFVDIITNGMGGMLVLFLVLVIVQAEWTWLKQTGSASNRPLRREHPFVILVQLKDAAPTSVKTQVEFMVKDADFGTTYEYSNGPTYAVMYAYASPGKNAKISANLPESHSGGELHIFDGKTNYPVKMFEKGQIRLRVWPPTGGRLP